MIEHQIWILMWLGPCKHDCKHVDDCMKTTLLLIKCILDYKISRISQEVNVTPNEWSSESLNNDFISSEFVLQLRVIAHPAYTRQKLHTVNVESGSWCVITKENESDSVQP